MKCQNKDCKATLSNPYECKECGWSSRNKPEATEIIKQSPACHKDIDGYYRVFRSTINGIESLRYKCSDRLLYADLDWRDKAYKDFLEVHKEFKFKPETDMDQKDMQEMSMAYLKKILKGGITHKLPYDKSQQLSAQPDYNEQELINQLSPIRFDDL